MNKLAHGIAALVLLIGSVFAADSYYIFSGNNKVAWGTENYVMGFTWGTVTLGNPENPYSTANPKDKDFVNEGVGKIVNASVPAGGGVYIGAKTTGKATNGKVVTDCSGGFSYWYRGGAHKFTIEYPKSNCGGVAANQWNNKWQAASADAATVWTKRTVTLAQLTQIPGGDCNKAVDLSIAEQLAWGTQVDADATAVTGYNLAIGNVACIGSGAALTGDVAPTAGTTWIASTDEFCPSSSNYYYCKWETCGALKTDKENATKPITTCEAAISNCLSYSTDKKVYSNSTCTNVAISPSSSSAAPTVSSSSVGGAASSSSVGGAASSSSSVASGGGSSSSVVGGSSSSGDGGGDEPIISYNKAPVVGLSVISFARSLQIASSKDATVALFDMQGKQVFSQKVLSGTTILSLAKQRQGVYYAVVTSGAQKQTVKVILK